jgi:hypothetical protein
MMNNGVSQLVPQNISTRVKAYIALASIAFTINGGRFGAGIAWTVLRTRFENLEKNVSVHEAALSRLSTIKLDMKNPGDGVLQVRVGDPKSCMAGSVVSAASIGADGKVDLYCIPLIQR